LTTDKNGTIISSVLVAVESLRPTAGPLHVVEPPYAVQPRHAVNPPP
ncbi:hypothetical protein A2U01_0093581, partial [Trifolium medium]|nr:hypothetical protein [Trifolium medium]